MLDTSQLNKHDKVYHQLTFDILTDPRLNFRKADRVVIDTMGVFGNQVEYDLSDGTIPLSNTKNIGYKTQLFPEVVGFMRGENNLKWYLEQGMKIWTPNAFNFYRKKLDEGHPWKSLGKDTPDFNAALNEFEDLVMSEKDPRAGDLGEFYSRQWRAFRGEVSDNTNPEKQMISANDLLKIIEGYNNWGDSYLSPEEKAQTLYQEHLMSIDYERVDQLQDMIDKLKNQPTGRYALVTAWNPHDVKNEKAALAPCHVLFQAYRYTDTEGEERLDMKMHQRSADHHLGVAFNAPQYAAVTATLANIVGVKPGRFIHTFGDLHLYIGAGERSAWYKDRENISWLQNELRDNHPNDVLEKLLERLPDEGDFPGYDHVPFAIQQLGRESNSEPAKLEVSATSLDDMVVKDLKVTGYKRAPKLEINGVRPGMAS